MQFMTMLKMREDVGAPSPEFLEAMGAYIAGVAASGRLLTTGACCRARWGWRCGRPPAR